MDSLKWIWCHHEYCSMLGSILFRSAALNYSKWSGDNSGKRMEITQRCFRALNGFIFVLPFVANDKRFALKKWIEERMLNASTRNNINFHFSNQRSCEIWMYACQCRALVIDWWTTPLFFNILFIHIIFLLYYAHHKQITFISSRTCEKWNVANASKRLCARVSSARSWSVLLTLTAVKDHLACCNNYRIWWACRPHASAASSRAPTVCCPSTISAVSNLWAIPKARKSFDANWPQHSDYWICMAGLRDSALRWQPVW